MHRFILIPLLLIVVFATACDDDDDPVVSDDGNLTLSINGLQNLGADNAYEGWIIVDGSPVSTGTFTVDDNENLSQTVFSVDREDLNAASAFVLTIEPRPDSDPAPSMTHLLAGDFDGNSGMLSIGHDAALATDLKNAAGTYILATPTNGPDSEENSGVWWLDPAVGPGASLLLPVLPDGWIYEGWAVINGTPVTTGKFEAADEADDFDGYSSVENAPPFPGEDFLINAPMGVTFPTMLNGQKVVISVEPDPDNSDAPFLLKPLVATVPADAADHVSYEMSNNATGSNPSGSVMR